MPNNKHGAIVADPRSLIRHRYSLIPRRTFPVRKIQFPVPAPREFPDSTLKVRVFFRFDHRFVRQIQRNSLFFPCKQGNPLGAGFAADWSLRQSPVANCRNPSREAEFLPSFKGVWPDRPNLRDWRSSDIRSLNCHPSRSDRTSPILVRLDKITYSQSVIGHAQPNLPPTIPRLPSGTRERAVGVA
jgi:hypothetical protein